MYYLISKVRYHPCTIIITMFRVFGLQGDLVVNTELVSSVIALFGLLNKSRFFLNVIYNFSDKISFVGR